MPRSECIHHPWPMVVTLPASFSRWSTGRCTALPAVNNSRSAEYTSRANLPSTMSPGFNFESFTGALSCTLRYSPAAAPACGFASAEGSLAARQMQEQARTTAANNETAAMFGNLRHRALDFELFPNLIPINLLSSAKISSQIHNVPMIPVQPAGQGTTSQIVADCRPSQPYEAACYACRAYGDD